MTKIKQSKITKSAKGKDCQVRLPLICNFNPETTIFAHIGGAGIGMKKKDLFGAFCCSSCHDHIDGRVPSRYSQEYLKLAHYEGMERTQEILLSNGLVVIK